MSTLKMFKEER